MLHLNQALGHSFIGCVTVGFLRTALRRCHNEARWPVFQAHPGFDLVTMLSTRTTRDEEFEIAIVFKGLSICRMSSHFEKSYHGRVS